MATKLERALAVIGWQGGTVAQVNNELNTALNCRIDINLMGESEFAAMLFYYTLRKKAKQSKV